MRKIMNWQTNQIFLASILVAVSGILYGFLGFLGTHALREHMDIPTMLFWRFLIAGIWMFCFSLKNYMKQKKTSPALDKRVLLFMFALGAVGYAGSSGFYFLASQYTGTGLAMVIFFSYPIMIAMLSWMFHRHRLSKSIVFMPYFGSHHVIITDAR
jgi:drug/metabolite transporter (DMT)-like permease